MARIIQVDFSKRGKDLYYMQKELRSDRAAKRLEFRNERAAKRNEAKWMSM